MSVDTTSTKKKSSALSGFKNLFVQEVPEANDQGEPAPVTRTRAPAQGSAPSSILAPTTRVDDSKVAVFKGKLQTAIESNKLEGYDYLKFKVATTDLASDIPDERQRFKAVFATAKSMGISKDKLLETAKHYLLVLDQENKNFLEAVGDETADRIVAASATVRTIEADIDAKKDQIQKINDEIAALSQRSSELTAKITEEQSTIESRKSSFDAAYSSMVQEINNDVAKLNSFVG